MTNRFLHLLVIVLLLAGVSTVRAQLTNEQLGAVYYAYHAPASVVPATAPDGYSLVYVSHYGRHGSRWLVNDSEYEWVMAQFRDDNNLTRNGRRLKRLLTEVCANAKGNGGQLTSLGAKQHVGIARRMVARFPSLFADSVRVDARSSVSNRCRMSMLAFLPVIDSLAPKARITAITDSADMLWMSYDSPDLLRLMRHTGVPLGISTDRFVGNLFKDKSRVADGEKLLDEIFMMASDMQDLEDFHVSLYPFFTRAEMEAWYNSIARRMWMQCGLDPRNHDIPAQSAAHLWGNIVGEADLALASGRRVATLRFGHDTALYRLLSLLGSSTVADDKGMNIYDIIPMAANLQMAFYRRVSAVSSSTSPSATPSSPAAAPASQSVPAAADSVLVSFYLNERPMRLIGVDSVAVGGQKPHPATLYRWADVKRHLNHFLVAQQAKDREEGVRK